MRFPLTRRGPTTLSRFITYLHIILPFQFVDSLSVIGLIAFVRLLYNCRRHEIANNDMLEHYGDVVHGFAIRLAVTRFVVEHPNMNWIHKACAIESLVFTFTQNEYMGRAMASGVDLKDVQLPPEKRALIEAWMKAKDLECPKPLADLMEAICWGAEVYAGFNAVVEYNYTNFFAAFSVSLNTFDRRFRSQGPQKGAQRVIDEIQLRWRTQHNQELNPSHITAFLRDFDSIPNATLQHHFNCLKFSNSTSLFDTRGTFHLRVLFLSYFGFNVLDYYFRKEIDNMYPRYRASVSGGAHYGTTLRRIVLGDYTLAYIADKIKICAFPPNTEMQTKAQVLSAAVGQLFIDDPESADWELSLPLGTLVKLARDVVHRLNSELLPVMPTTSPYPMIPLPYESDESTPPPSEPVAPISQSSPPPASPPTALVVSPSASLKTKVHQAAKALIKPFHLSKSGSTKKISISPSTSSTSSTSPASPIPESNPEPCAPISNLHPEPVTHPVPEPSSKGLTSSRLPKQPSSSKRSSNGPSSASASASTSSHLAHHPQPVQKKETVTGFRNRMLKKGKMAGQSATVPRLRRK